MLKLFLGLERKLHDVKESITELKRKLPLLNWCTKKNIADAEGFFVECRGTLNNSEEQSEGQLKACHRHVQICLNCFFGG
jgi:hypothetical protein